MGVGGATWDTAGTLELGSGNTFDPADATEDGPEFTFIESVAWWTYTASEITTIGITPANPADVRLRFYEGDDYASKVQVSSTGVEDATEFYPVQAGVTYHLMMGTAEAHTPPALYQVTLDVPTLSRSPWFDTLSTRDDNQLVVSDGALGEDNPESWQFVPWGPEIFGTAARMPPRRTGTWSTLQSLGGPDTGDVGAVNCVWSHAKNGDGLETGGGGTWDGTCASLGTGESTRRTANTSIGWGLSVHEGGPFTPGSTSASATIRAQGFWFALARPYLPEQGILDIPDPTSQGYPADAQIEWEGDLKLVKIELAGDSFERPAEGTTDSLDPIVYMLRRDVAPDYLGGDPLTEDVWTPFYLGGALIWDGTKTDLTYQWGDGDPEWTEVDGLVSGDDGWDGLATSYEDQPDEVAVIGLARSFLTPPDVDGNSRDARTAVRYTFQSPRYRWVYESQTTTIPPRRIFGRSDGATHGARRALGGGNTRQAGRRTLGSIL